MRTLTRSILAATAVVGLLALPVTGAVGADNTVSFTVEATSSALSVDNDGSAVTLSDGGSALGALTGGDLSGSLPSTTVTDQRGTLGGTWAVTVGAVDWVHGTDPSVTLGGENAHVYLDAADLTELTGTLLSGAVTGMTILGAEYNVGSNDLSGDYQLINGSTTLGNGTVDYTPVIDITVPANTPAGTYSATVTQTVG